ncbi:hypothetical protein NLC35_02725 [Candidatus Aminicenantes bacterium AC-334-K16]|mgnify:CR=1 FL=1|jgi:hypothetical protein|nr:hypothetical protein [Candidatus Aminicenantes bacterium AC-334-K16]
MSHKKSQAALEKELSSKKGEIIPWPNLEKFLESKLSSKKSSIKITPKYLYYKDKKIPISQFQKAGYDKLLQLLIKEIER